MKMWVLTSYANLLMADADQNPNLLLDETIAHWNLDTEQVELGERPHEELHQRVPSVEVQTFVEIDGAAAAE